MGYSNSIVHLIQKMVTTYWVLVLQAQLIIGEKVAPPLQVKAPNCSNKCGNISISYPFGIEDGCYLKDHNNSFKIYCNQTSIGTHIPTLMLDGYYKLELLSISVMESEIQCKLYAAYDCYDKSGPTEWWRGGVYLDSFTVSSTKNTLVGIGCDTYAWSQGYRGNKVYSTGCSTQCSELGDVGTNGQCTFIGCCEAPIISGLKNITYGADGFYEHSSVYDFNPCSVAFPVAKDAFRFYPINISQSRAALNEGVAVPVILNWVIGQKNCSVAKADGSCLCKENADCYDPDYELGYRCKCRKGFSGNPYLRQGCLDVNECNGDNNCEKSEYCMNTIGGYYCKCPQGFHGNGTKTHPCIRSSKALQIAVGLSGTFGLILLALAGWWLYLVIKRTQVVKQRAKYFEINGGLLLQQQMSSKEGIVERIKIFTIDELEKATDYFSKDRILGQGGYGTVYKGMLGQGRIVAVKKSNKVEGSRIGEFINEVVILSQINHRNIVKLLGCCLETKVPLLVYEFIPNGTVFHHIHNPSEEFPITWRMRLQIASDSAAALAYLHSSSSTLIFHRDIKSSNILLDDKYRAKLSDFGTSRSVAIDQTHVFTRVMGTYGYIDPEYIRTHQFTEKSDVYSFGVVLVELLTGQKAIRIITEEEDYWSLTSWFLYNMENSSILDIVDSQVLQEGSIEEILSIANLANQCLNLDGKNRPTMKEVLLQIEALLLLHMPKTFNLKSKKIDHGTTNNTPQHSSNFYLGSKSSHSAELSLIFNPR